jgi:hypothetical protein
LGVGVKAQACFMLCKDGLASPANILLHLGMLHYSLIGILSSHNVFQSSKGLAGRVQLVVSDGAHQVQH